MALTGFLLTTLLHTFPQSGGALACTFPDLVAGDLPITLQIQHTPSLFDTGVNYQVQMEIGRAGPFDAAAGPEAGSAQWDVVIRGVQDDSQVAIGLKADGTAMMRMVSGTAGDQTRAGHCQGHERYIRRWTS